MTLLALALASRGLWPRWTDSPLGTLIISIIVVTAPWWFQVTQSRESRVGSSPMDEDAQRLWGKVGLIVAGVLVAVAVTGKALAWFDSWTRW